MKKLMYIFLFGLFACENPPYIKAIGKEDTNTRTGGTIINYFKDERTGLCFASTGGEDSYSFTCVPCDSLLKLEDPEVKLKRTIKELEQRHTITIYTLR